MQTNAPLTEVLHFDPIHPCCDTPGSADLFPDLLHLDNNKLNRGRVAAISVESCGLGSERRKLIADARAWEDCVKSPNFRACYDLSMAKLALQEALSSRWILQL